MTRDCVRHPGRPEAIVCDWFHPEKGGAIRDFCAECIDEGRHTDNFGRCYECADGLHERCIGVPCQCECPPTPADVLDREIAAVEHQLQELRRRKEAIA